jgi:2',3'-cyclic-nucleotide 2'-phosphodiesterase (5'-nucleotidase family)
MNMQPRFQNDGSARWRVCAILLAAAGVFLLACVCAAGLSKGTKPNRLTIVYTSDEVGQIRSCNCSKFRFGGYAREATAMAQIRKEARDVVVIEGGDFLGQPDVPQDRLKAKVAANAMKAIGYSALVPGEMDLDFGLSELEKLRAESGVPFVVANACSKATGKPLFEKPYAIVQTAGGINVAIIGLLDSGMLPRSASGQSSVTATDPVAALKQTIGKVKDKASFIIVVAHTTYDRGKVLARVPGADVVILAHRESEHVLMPEKGKDSVEAPFEKVGNCLLLKSHTRTGWSIGRLDVTIKPGKSKDAGNKLIYLNRSFDESPVIVKLYEAYNKEVQDLVLRQQKQMKDQVLAQLVSHGIDPSKYKKAKPYATSEACKSCHEQAYETWKKSRHATAFASLEKRSQSFDPECIACHTTGSMTRGGFTDAKSTPELINVQCESCHGPGAAHIAKPAKGFGSTGEDNCRSCHTEAYNPDFDYDALWKIVAH